MIPFAAVLVAFALSRPAPTDAVIEPIYTLPFYDSFNLACGFHCYYDPVYGWHEGVDYEIAPYGVGGQAVAAGAAGVSLNPRSSRNFAASSSAMAE